MKKSLTFPKLGERVVDWLMLLLIAIFSIWLMWGTFGHHPDGGLAIDSKLWSDFGAHIPLIRSFSMGGNWPPEYPTFPGEPIRYHYLFYLMVGLLERLGLSLVFALNFLSAFGLGLMLFLLYDLARRIHSSRIAGALALYLTVFNGSLSFVDYFLANGLSWQSIIDISQATQFASFGPWGDTLVSAFWNLNIYTNQRHLGLSFAVGLLLLRPALLALYTDRQFKKTDYIFAFGLGLILAWLNNAVFAMILLLLPILAALQFVSQRKISRYYFFVFLGMLPGLLILISRGTSFVVLKPGFLSDSPDLGSIVIYWFFNMGLYWLLLPVLLLWEFRRKRLIAFVFLPLFLLANLFRLSPDMINNHKLINFFWLSLIISYAGLLKRIWNQGSIFYRFITISLVGLMSFSGFVDFFPIVNDHFIHLDDFSQSTVSTWVLHHTPADSVFLTTSYLYHPALLAGRSTYLDYGYFNWSLGYDESYRRSLLPELFSQKPVNEICNLLLGESIDYVSVSKEPELEVNVLQSTILQSFSPVAADLESYTIYDVSDNCGTFL